MLNDVAVYIREDPAATEQTPYENADGAAWLVAEYEPGGNGYEFDEVSRLHADSF